MVGPVFTGLIEAVGRLVSHETRGPVVRLWISAPLASQLGVGASIAVDGVCLSVVDVRPDSFAVEATGETLRRTTLATWRGPRPVNLERPLRADGRLDGHLVMGHVDGIVPIVRREVTSRGHWLWVRHIPSLAPLIAAQGSVALDGVSLTVAQCTEEQFAVSLIPLTLARTTLGGKEVGDYLNLEVDVLARYVARLLAARSRQEDWDEWV